MSQGFALVNVGLCFVLSGAWICILIYPHNWLWVDVMAAIIFDIGLYKIDVSKGVGMIAWTSMRGSTEKKIAALTSDGLLGKTTICEVQRYICQVHGLVERFVRLGRPSRSWLHVRCQEAGARAHSGRRCCGPLGQCCI